MFTLRRNSHKQRASISFSSSSSTSTKCGEQPKNSANTSAVADNRQSRNSMLITGTHSEYVIHLVLGAGCFREALANNNNSNQYSLSVFNQICSLLVFSLREFTEHDAGAAAQDGGEAEPVDEQRTSSPNQQRHLQITVLLDAPKVPLKALRIVLRACQSALAYKIRQCVLLEPDSFFSQQRIALDALLLDAYDFKVIVCARTKLTKHIGLANLFDLQPIWREKASGVHPRKSTVLTDVNNNATAAAKSNGGGGGNNEETVGGKWTDVKKDFLSFFSANPSYFASSGAPSVCAMACIARLARKERTILIELVEHDLDSVLIQPTGGMKANVAAGQDTTETQVNELQKNDIAASNGQERATRKMSSSSAQHQLLQHSMGTHQLEQRRTNSAEQQQRPLSQRHSAIEGGGGGGTIPVLSLFAQSLPVRRDLQQQHSAHKNEQQRNNGTTGGAAVQPDLAECAARLTGTLQRLLGWLGECGERRLATLERNISAEASCNVATLDQVGEQREQLSREIEECGAELASVDEHLERLERKRMAQSQERPKELIALAQLALGAQSQLHRLRTALSALKLRVENARRFRVAIREFHAECDALLLALCAEDGERELALHEVNIRARIASLKERVQKIDKSAQLATETGAIFRTLLEQQAHDQGHLLVGVEQTTLLKYVPPLPPEVLIPLVERQRRCAALVDLRIGRLNQRLQIIKCEQYGDQIIGRFNESLRTNNAQLIEELLHRQRNGDRLVDCARQMGNIARVLRKVNQLEAMPTERFMARLETLWAMLDRIQQQHANANGNDQMGCERRGFQQKV